jgi:predicted 2-oxoglutarate/Fe(II)-dependent dioxygenase YbiX
MDRLPLPLFAALLPTAVSAARCAELVAQATGTGFAKTGGAYPPGYRNNDRLVVDDPGLAAELCRLPGLAALLERHRTFLAETLGEGWTFVGLNPRFRFCRYTDGQAFCRHRDGAYQRGEHERSFLTLQLYLDEDFAGGATRFFRGPVDEPGETAAAFVVPVRGQVVVFDHRLWHDGEAVFRGTKHVLRTDLLFRRTGPTSATTTNTSVAAPYLFVARKAVDGDGREHLLTGGRDGAVRIHAVAEDTAQLVETARILTGVPRSRSSVTAIVQRRASLAGAGAVVVGRRDGRVFTISMEPLLDEAGAGSALAVPAVQLASAITGLCRAPHGASADEVWATTASDGVLTLRWTGDGLHVATWSLSVAGGATYEAGRSGWLWGLTPSGFVVGDAGLFRLDRHTRSGVLLRSPDGLRSVTSSPAGRLAVGDRRGFVHLDVPSGRARSFRAHRGAIRDLVFEDEQTLTTVSEDCTLARFDLHDTAAPRLLERRPHDDFVCSIEQLCDKSVVSVGYDGKTRRFGPRGFTPGETSTKTAARSWPQASKT